MAYAARLRRYVPMVLVLWPALGGMSSSRVSAQSPGGPTDLFVPPCPKPAVPEFPRLDLDGGPAPDAAPREEQVFVPFNSWSNLHPGDLERRKAANQADVGSLGQISSEVVMRAPERSFDTPFERGEWSREDTLKMPVAGPLALFGQTSMNGNYTADQNMSVVGRTGAILKVPVGSGSMLELRGGPTIKYNDALRPDRTREQASVLLEVQAKYPLLGGIGLEYSGAALPAMTALDRPKLNQSLGLAIPVSGGKLKLGAKHHWEQQFQGTTPGVTNMELFVGVEIGR